MVQIALGAFFRHQAIGVMAHIVGALIVVLLVLLNGMFVTQQCPGHKPLVPAASTLMTVAFLQIVLGIGALTARMVTTLYTPAVAATTAAHVVNGSLVFGASVLLSLQVQSARYAERRVERTTSRRSFRGREEIRRRRAMWEAFANSLRPRR